MNDLQYKIAAKVAVRLLRKAGKIDDARKYVQSMHGMDLRRYLTAVDVKFVMRYCYDGNSDTKWIKIRSMWDLFCSKMHYKLYPKK